MAVDDGLLEAYERLQLSHDLAIAISGSISVDEALAATLRLFTEAGGWALGQVWLPDPTGQVLTCGPIWYAREPGLNTFREASLKLNFRPGEPLLGLVWEDGRSRWAEDIDGDRLFRRAEAAAAVSLRAALIVPIGGPTGVTAVMEFFTREEAPKNAGVRQLIDATAAQLGSLMAQKAAEADLRRTEARFRAVAETANDAIVTIDSTGTIVYVNQGTETLFGYPERDLLGGLVTRLIPERFHPDHTAGFNRYLHSGESRLIGSTVFVHGLASDGRELPVELSLATWDEDGSPHFTAIIRDVSDRQRMQDELQVALAEEQATASRLQEIDWVKNIFLDAVSHDLRGPLAALKAATLVLELDANQPSLRPDQRESYLTRMNASINKMGNLLDDLLNMERLHAGEVSMQLAPANVADLVRRSVEEHRGAFGSRTITLNLEPVVMQVDAAKVDRMVENLLINACRHTPTGTEVAVFVRSREEEVVIGVDDAGPGVPEEMRTIIFDRFKQTAGGPGEGVGMGLSLVARLAKLHGGRAWVEERPGGGAAFRLSLPKAGSADDRHGLDG